MKNLKKFLAVVLAVAMIVTSFATVAADTADPLAEKYPEAALMRDLGILKGSTGGVTEAYLQQKPVRIQAAILTLRLMGKEQDALAYSGLAHFEDKIADTYWAKNVMGYLKANPGYGWRGDNYGKLNPEARTQKEEFAKVILTALGYEQGTHYDWEGVMAAYKAAGLRALEEVDSAGITMNDIAIALDEALRTYVRGSSTETLAWRLSLVNPEFKAAALAKGLIQPVTIKSVVNPDLGSVGEGSVVYPPAQVLATMSDGSTKMVDVKWEAEKFDTSKAGDVTLKGTIEGFEAGATATLKVIAAEIVGVADVVLEDAYVGQEVTLPETVKATFSNGKVADVPVTWDPATVDTSKEAELTFKGTVAGYNGEIVAAMNVVEDGIAKVDVQDVTINEGAALGLPAEVDATYKSGKVEKAAVEWDTSAVKTNVPGTYEVVGKIGDYEVKVKVVVNALALDFALSADNLKEVVVTFNKPVASENITVDNFLVNGVKPVAVSASADGKVVTLTAATAISQQSSFEVKVLKALGLSADLTKKLDNIADLKIPQVVSVVPKGNSFLQITFSEPVQKAAAEYLGNYTIDGAIYSALNPVLSADGRVVEISLNARMPEGVRKVVVSSNIKDEAGYGLAPNSTEIAIAADTTAPASAAVSGTPTQKELKVVFNEPVASVSAQFPGGSAVAGVADNADKTIWKFTFGAGNYIPANADITISLIDVTDFNGNKANLSVKVNIVPDLTRPAYVKYEQTGSNTIVFEFSKSVLEQGRFEFTDKNGYKFALNLPQYVQEDTNGDGVQEDVTTKLYLTDPRINSDNAPYTVVISNVLDDTPLANSIIPTTVTGMVIGDKVKPQVSGMTFAGTKLYIAFSEKVDVASAVTASNYTVISPAGIASAVPSDAVISVAGDGKTVVITFATGYNIVANIGSLTIKGVKDVALNEMDAVAKTITGTDASNTPINMTGAEITDKNTLKVAVDCAPEVIYPSDFVIVAGAQHIAATSAVYDSGYIVLTTNYAFTSDAKYNGNPVTVSLVASPLTKNLYGKPISGGPYQAVDKIAPSATEAGSAYYTAGVNKTTINIRLSEDLNSALEASEISQNSQFMVTLDGKLVSASAHVTFISKANAVVADDDAPVLRFTIDATGDTTGKAFNVKFVPAASTNIIDANNNGMAAFDLSGTVQYDAR